MNTKRRTSQLGCRVRQRIRARLTSGRSCSAARVVFFITQTQAVQTMPESGDPNRDVQPVQTPLLQFDQRQVRLGFNPALQHRIMVRQTRAPIATDLFRKALSGATMLFPKSLNTLAADPEPLANLAGAFAAFARSNNPLPKSLAQGTHR